MYWHGNGVETAGTGHGRTFNDDEGQGKVRSRAGQARSALERSQEHVRALYLPTSAQLCPQLHATMRSCLSGPSQEGSRKLVTLLKQKN